MRTGDDLLVGVLSAVIVAVVTIVISVCVTIRAVRAISRSSSSSCPEERDVAYVSDLRMRCDASDNAISYQSKSISESILNRFRVFNNRLQISTACHRRTRFKHDLLLQSSLSAQTQVLLEFIRKTSAQLGLISASQT